jgi:signal transduction histidine kinase
MLSPIDSKNYICQLTATQIQEILVLNGVAIQRYQPQSQRWLTIVQVPDLGRSIVSLEPAKEQEIDMRLHSREIVEFTATTTVMNIHICDRYVFVPLIGLPTGIGGPSNHLWGRICLLGNQKSVWTAQDLSWVQALGQQLLIAIDGELGIATSSRSAVTNISPLADLAELIERISELEANCQQKDEFISTMSHDLRAPLMNIKMAVRMLKISLNSDPQIAALIAGHQSEQYLAILETECDRELAAIDNILELQKLDLTDDLLVAILNKQANIEAVEIATWLPTTIEPFIHRADTRHQALTTSTSEWLPTISTDRVYLTKILTELVNNACKYTQSGGRISVEVDSNPNSESLTIAIKNQAEIAEKHLPYIFDRFYRVPGGDRDRQGGSGLGLSIVQKLVQQLNGQIHVASINGWTEFAVRLPIQGVRSME